ncbi:hypothetical protein [Ornithinimicrobium kibberense]|uniref:hypothetical protein n=1 Tax=Ornithinimicrobium kibberense TaxID=282060 RepID=UPI003620F6BB
MRRRGLGGGADRRGRTRPGRARHRLGRVPARPCAGAAAAAPAPLAPPRPGPGGARRTRGQTRPHGGPRGRAAVARGTGAGRGPGRGELVAPRAGGDRQDAPAARGGP